MGKVGQGIQVYADDCKTRSMGLGTKSASEAGGI